MKIADRYIMKEFVRGLFISLVGLLVIYIIVDVFEQISKFVDNGVSVYVIMQYYIYQIPWIIGTTLSPIACMLGCFISIGTLSRHFELAAFRFSGASAYRLSLPIFGIGIVFSVLVLVVNETLSPLLSQKKIELESERINKRPKVSIVPSRNIYYTGEDNKFYHIKYIDPRQGVIQGLTIYEFGVDYSIKRRSDAVRAVWDGRDWTLIKGSIKVFNPDAFAEMTFDSLVLGLKEAPLDLVKEVKSPLGMGFFEFRRYINKMQRGGEDVNKELVDLWTRLSFPFMNLIVLLLGFPLASRVRNTGFIIGFAIALFVSFLYWGFMQLAKAFGHSGLLSPAVASIMPNLIFFVGAAVLIWRFRK
ncbi:MAG: LptF/LptG family permease [Candidatus Stahlbacteria bacterium]|nr:LptF/LptG family permease [Candidatus Stahlbacteria bacterium]